MASAVARALLLLAVLSSAACARASPRVAPRDGASGEGGREGGGEDGADAEAAGRRGRRRAARPRRGPGAVATRRAAATEEEEGDASRGARRNSSTRPRLDFQTSHKFGTQAMNAFRKARFQDAVSHAEARRRSRIAPHVDVPTVVVVRDLFDATVSGYLYHKSGRECWLNAWGKDNSKLQKRNDWLNRVDWRRDVSTVPLPRDDGAEATSAAVPVAVPPRDRSLCAFLAAADETTGVGAYLEWARTKFYRDAAALRARAEDPALFVCYEELTTRPDAAEARIRAFWRRQQRQRGNATDATNATAAEGGVRRRLAGDRDGAPYRGGHATDPDPALRARLRAIAVYVDAIYFDGETQAWNEALNCTSEAARREDASEEAGRRGRDDASGEGDREEREDADGNGGTLGKRMEVHVAETNRNGRKLDPVHFTQWVAVVGVLFFCWQRLLLRLPARAAS